MIICQKCGAAVTQVDKFCTSCGAAVVPAKPLVGERICGKCGNLLSATATFCSQCGTPMRAASQVTTMADGDPESGGALTGSISGVRPPSPPTVYSAPTTEEAITEKADMLTSQISKLFGSRDSATGKITPEPAQQIPAKSFGVQMADTAGLTMTDREFNVFFNEVVELVRSGNSGIQSADSPYAEMSISTLLQKRGIALNLPPGLSVKLAPLLNAKPRDMYRASSASQCTGCTACTVCSICKDETVSTNLATLVSSTTLSP